MGIGNGEGFANAHKVVRANNYAKHTRVLF